MKSLIRLLLLLLLIGGILYITISQRNHTSLSPSTIDLSVDCSDVDKLGVTSSVNVIVENHSARIHNDVSVKLTAYDANDNIVQEKYTTFSRELRSNSQFDKPVLMNKATQRCKCEIVSAH